MILVYLGCNLLQKNKECKMDQSDNFKTLIDKIKDSIKSDGAFLELQVLQALEDRTFDVQLSVYYEDLVTKKLREIDVIADFRDSTPRFEKEVIIKYVIECKHVFKPWAILTSQYLNEDDELKYLSLNREIVCNKSAQPFVKKISDSFKFKASKKLLFDSRNIGYAVKQINFKKESKGNDVPFEAINGLASSVKYIKQEADKSNNFIFIVPIVVFSGNDLYVTYVDKNNELVVEDVKYGAILHQADVIDFSAVRINIVNFSHFDEFINEIQEGVEEIVYELVDVNQHNDKHHQNKE